MNETVHQNVNLQEDESWNPEMYAKKIIMKNFTGVITSQTFSLLPNVKEIYFAHGSIAAIKEDAFIFNPKLEVLQFSYNTYLPVLSNGFLRSCKNLRKFIMGHNKKIESVSDSLFSNLHNLTHIEVTKENKIPKRISKALFQNSKSLESIKIHFSNISAIDADAFEDLNKLQFLSLVENDIVEIGQSAFKSPKLTEVYLGWNKLNSFTGNELSNLRNLKSLDVSFNPLTTLNLKQIREKAPNLRILSLMKNGLSCDDKRIIKMQESSFLEIRMDPMEIEKCET